MAIILKCPDCRRILRVGDEVAGIRVRCPDCRSSFVAPGEMQQPGLIESVILEEPVKRPHRDVEDEEDRAAHRHNRPDEVEIDRPRQESIHADEDEVVESPIAQEPVKRPTRDEKGEGDRGQRRDSREDEDRSRRSIRSEEDEDDRSRRRRSRPDDEEIDRPRRKSSRADEEVVERPIAKGPVKRPTRSEEDEDDRSRRKKADEEDRSRRRESRADEDDVIECDIVEEDVQEPTKRPSRDEEEDRPRRKNREYDDDDRPRRKRRNREDDYDEPRRSRRDYDDDDDYDRPAKRRRKPQQMAALSTPLIYGILSCLCGIPGVGAYLGHLARNKADDELYRFRDGERYESLRQQMRIARILGTIGIIINVVPAVIGLLVAILKNG